MSVRRFRLWCGAGWTRLERLGRDSAWTRVQRTRFWVRSLRAVRRSWWWRIRTTRVSDWAGCWPALAVLGADIRVLCLTAGEASTLGAVADLAEIRRDELSAAAAGLGIGDVALLDFPDGGLDGVDPDALDAVVVDALGTAATLVVFESSGVTGHPDHRAATASAVRVARERGLRVLEWGVAPAVADTLNASSARPSPGSRVTTCSMWPSIGRCRLLPSRATRARPPTTRSCAGVSNCRGPSTGSDRPHRGADPGSGGCGNKHIVVDTPGGIIYGTIRNIPEEIHRVLPRHLQDLLQDHVGRLRPARRQRHADGPSE